MVASIHDLKVLWIVVQRIAVNMVDDLFRPKSATERILRDEAMFGHPPTTDRQVAVALVDPALSGPRFELWPRMYRFGCLARPRLVGRHSRIRKDMDSPYLFRSGMDDFSSAAGDASHQSSADQDRNR